VSESMIPRRNFLQLAGLFLGSLPWLGNTSGMETRFPKSKVGVLQGPTNATSTILTVVLHKTVRAQFQVQAGGLAAGHIETTVVDLGLGDFVVHQLFVSQLELGANYTLQIWDPSNDISEVRQFKALDLENINAKIAVISCSNHSKAGHQSLMYGKLTAAAPDAIFFVGDMVYANRPLDTVLGQAAPPDKAFDLYLKSFLSLDLYSQLQLIPSFSIWDDHDMGKDGANTNHPHKAIMIKMFRTFFPIDERIPELTSGPGVSFALDAFGCQSLFLDGRVFANGGIFLGAEQTKWMQGQYMGSDKPAMMICGQQFWSYDRINDSFQKDAGPEFAEFLKFLKNNRKPTLFVSGDVHYSQIQSISGVDLGYSTFEVSSSALFSQSSKEVYQRPPGSGQMAYYGRENFLVLDQFKPSRDGLDFRVTCVSEKSDLQFQKSLSI